MWSYTELVCDELEELDEELLDDEVLDVETIGCEEELGTTGVLVVLIGKFVSIFHAICIDYIILPSTS